MQSASCEFKDDFSPENSKQHPAPADFAVMQMYSLNLPGEAHSNVADPD